MCKTLIHWQSQFGAVCLCYSRPQPYITQVTVHTDNILGSSILTAQMQICQSQSSVMLFNQPSVKGPFEEIRTLEFGEKFQK